MNAAAKLSDWAAALEPTEDDLALARRSLLDTVAVALAAAARETPDAGLLAELGEAGRWAARAHVLDFDDLHLLSTTHISAVCVPVALACGGGARAYLAGAGVMARLGAALGWSHYSRGWHATCTAGAPAAAVTAAAALGLDAQMTAVAIALAVPAAGGVQRAFGTSAKSLQVGFSADAGVRAARLAAAGASADPAALDQWLALVGGDPTSLDTTPRTRAVPGGLAIKLHPCCYALQRPIAAMRELRAQHPELHAEQVRCIRVTTPASALQPLIHDRPSSGLEGKFSLPYALAAALLDDHPDFVSFDDSGVQRAEARRLVETVEITATSDGDGLLDGEVGLAVACAGGATLTTALALPPGAPERPPTDEQLDAKLRACAPDPALADRLAALDWTDGAAPLRQAL